MCLAATAAMIPAEPAAGGTRRYRFVNHTSRDNVDHEASGTWGSLWIDHDRDGWPDLFIGRHGANPFFFRNSEGTYRREHIDFLRPPGYDPIDERERWVDRHNCAWGEATGDGRPDLYCAVGANRGTAVGPNQLLTWTNGVRDVAKRYGVRDIYGRGRSVNWLDADDDGDLDLYLGNWQRPNHPSAFFRNTRGRFERVKVGLSDQLRTISSSWSDWDRDGDPDLLVMQYAAPTVAYRNVGGRFVRVSLRGITGVNWYSAAWGDYNGDGRTDVHMVGESRETVFKNTGGAFRAVHSARLTEGRTSTWFDIENDGDLDLFVVRGAPGVQPSNTAVNRPDFVLLRRRGRFVKLTSKAFRGRARGSGDTVSTADHNRDGRADLFVTNGYFEYEQWRGLSTLLESRARAFRWVGLELRGGRWNPLGMGARVEVRSKHFRYRREVTDGVTFRAQSEVGYLSLGIRRARRVRVRVAWPDGTTDCVRAAHRDVISIRKGRRPCASRDS